MALVDSLVRFEEACPLTAGDVIPSNHGSKRSRLRIRSIEATKGQLPKKLCAASAHRQRLGFEAADGAVSIYFGGASKPDGPGHGHYVMDRNGKVTYKRDPFDEYGAQNFEENRRESATREMAQMAMNQWAKNQRTPRMTQYENFEFKVDVRSGYDRDRDCIVTDMLIYDKHNKREHYHLVIDERGHELFSEWRMNH